MPEDRIGVVIELVSGIHESVSKMSDKLDRNSEKLGQMDTRLTQVETFIRIKEDTSKADEQRAKESANVRRSVIATAIATALSIAALAQTAWNNIVKPSHAADSQKQQPELVKQEGINKK